VVSDAGNEDRGAVLVSGIWERLNDEATTLLSPGELESQDSNEAVVRRNM